VDAPIRFLRSFSQLPPLSSPQPGEDSFDLDVVVSPSFPPYESARVAFQLVRIVVHPLRLSVATQVSSSLCLAYLYFFRSLCVHVSSFLHDILIPGDVSLFPSSIYLFLRCLLLKP